MSEWIKHDGGECPVDLDDYVLVSLRGGFIPQKHEKAREYNWNFYNSPGDIVEYKLIKSISDFAHNQLYQLPDKTTIPAENDLHISQSALDTQVGGDHYKQFKIQPFEYITKNNMGFAQGNIIKYASRYLHKNGIEDLEKAKHYIDLEIERIRELGK